MGNIVIFDRDGQKRDLSIMVGVKMEKHQQKRDKNAKKFTINIFGCGDFFYSKISRDEHEYS
ncbi:hypothetical protein [Pectobacterium wasabiae]|uniref:hypothetical protein n=1 Tax=Pectobacterium wasabiae TaxID=55208 RepID=UPI00057D2D83|nr:hypothetical protein [Pectobacterium wasabiae]AOR65257.1 hypothetical protein A7983_18735 [Pectobacterium wasabiae CFBP 3304]